MLEKSSVVKNDVARDIALLKSIEPLSLADKAKKYNKAITRPRIKVINPSKKDDFFLLMFMFIIKNL